MVESFLKCKGIMTNLSFKRGKYLEISIAYLVVIIGLVFFIFPIFQFFLVSIQPTKYLLSLSLVPVKLTLENYRRILLLEDFRKSLINSLIISSFSTLTVMLISIPAAYSLSRFNYGRRENIAYFFLSLYMFPPIVAVIPIWRIVQNLKLLDNHFVLSAIYAFFNLPLSVWLLKIFFTTIPKEIEESAFIDGCSRLSSLYKIILPLALPGIVVTSILSFIFSWNEFLFAMILTQTKAKTLTVVIASQVSYFIEWGCLSSMTILTLIPVLLLSIFIQKYIISGLTLGAVKG